MRIGLVSYRCQNGNTGFNLSQIELAMKRSAGKADLLCFGEAFLQGFDSLCWDHETDKAVALDASADAMSRLRARTLQYGVGLITGYIEKDRDKLYSSCAVIAKGRIVHNYRRISKGWKEFTKTDEHYCEGDDTDSFLLNGREMKIALCGDLWDCPDRFKTEGLLIWPVYVNYTPEEWNKTQLAEYAAQAALAAKDVLMINPIDSDPVDHGGAFHFQNGRVAASLPFDREGILIVDV